MLLNEAFFRTFTTHELCNTRTHTEGLFALSCASRAEVDELVKKAIAAGGSRAMNPQDHGFMYASSFYDLDGHHWEVFWMDPAAA
jgi:predicted lactoylglutathione lyase